MVSSKPEIWVKSYPIPEQITALANVGADGIELFLDDNYIKSKGCLKIAKDNYSKIGIELFDSKRIGNQNIFYNFFSKDKEVMEISLFYLLNTIDLANQFNASHIQLNMNDGYIFGPNDKMALEDRRERILRFKEFIKNLGSRTKIPFYFENIFPISDQHANIRISSIGSNLNDFKDIPLEFDLAHYALTLNIYSRAKEFGFILNNDEKQLAKEVAEKGINAVIISHLKQIDRLPFVHFDNASRFEIGKKCDTNPENKGDRLLNLEEILPLLLEKAEKITPEVSAKDYVSRPNLRKWIKKLQEMIA